MGPIVLFDKSFLQSLSVDEAVWFDHFFSANICPVFYVETLADLAKTLPESCRNSLDEVRIIAEKSPTYGGYPCAHHLAMVGSDLNGRTPPMNGRIPVVGGRPVALGDKSGVIIDEPDEAKAFSRWQDKRFEQLEREFARAWRDSLRRRPEQYGVITTKLRSLGIDGKTCKSLVEVRQLANSLLESTERPRDSLQLALTFLGIAPIHFSEIEVRWAAKGFAPLYRWAPYAAHVALVEAFTHIALAARHIAEERASNQTDIAYLHYLPFCMLFVSSDKLHNRCAPLFLRGDQEFVWGPDLKKDLGRINEHFRRTVSEEQREKGIPSFAREPIDGGLVFDLWMRHLPGWRERRGREGTEKPIKRDPVKDREVVARLKAMNEWPEVDLAPDDDKRIDMMSIARRVRKKRGSWWQIPKELKEEADES